MTNKSLADLEKKLMLNTCITFFLAIVVFLIESVFMNVSGFLSRHPWALFVIAWDASVFYNAREYLKDWDYFVRMRELI